MRRTQCPHVASNRAALEPAGPPPITRTSAIKMATLFHAVDGARAFGGPPAACHTRCYTSIVRKPSRRRRSRGPLGVPPAAPRSAAARLAEAERLYQDFVA